MMEKNLIGILLLPALLLMQNAHAQAVLAAKANGIGITQQQLERTFEEDLRQRQLNLLQIRNPERVKQMKREILDKLIEQELFWQQAQQAGVVASDDEVEQAYRSTMTQFKSADAFERRLGIEGYTPQTYRLLVKKQVSATKYANGVGQAAPAVSDDEIHQFYRENPDKFQRPQQVRVRHILIKVAPDAADTLRTERRRHIDHILAKARAGTSFEELARQHSDAPTRQWGGEMEAVSRGQLPGPVEEAAFSLAPGRISGVIATPEGFHLLKVEEQMPAIVIGEEQARERIRDFLQQRKAWMAIEEEAARLRAAADIAILLPL